MYINVRTFDGKQNAVVSVSKTLSIEELKTKINCVMGVNPDKQRLFYSGKLLVDTHTLFDYNIKLNDVIQVMIKSEDPLTESQIENKNSIPPEDKEDEHNSCDSNSEQNDGTSVTLNNDIAVVKDENGSTSNTSSVQSQYFRVGDFVDVLDVSIGMWVEGKIKTIAPQENPVNNDTSSIPDDGLVYTVLLECNEELCAMLGQIRPRARHLVDCLSLKLGDTILANYNMDKPNERGHWYECTVSRLGKINRKNPEVYVNIDLGKGPLIKDAKLKFCNEIFKLEDRQLLSDIKICADQEPIPKRLTAPTCDFCGDRPNLKCKECGCHICGMKNDPEKQLMCDECDMAYHLQCLDPPLDSIPSVDEWFCPQCKNNENEIVKPGEKLKKSKKKENMPSAKKSGRDWGRGMACVGRTKECTLVKDNFFGPIPGVEVGTCWKFRMQVSESGVHRPPVAGIAGRAAEGAYSVVLSGGYEEDVDNGESFLYTGSGGRDLSGNKRTAEQSSDQTLTLMNKALALNCDAPFNEKGAKAVDWRNGKPIRVVRNYKASKHSKYAPSEGNRYDGIYKVVEYYPEKGVSGFTVWRYLLRRDDPTPAPWTKEGQDHIKKHGLKMTYPEGYLEAEAAKAAQAKEMSGNTNKKGKKRPLETKQLTLFDAKRSKIEKFSLNKELIQAIEEDNINVKLWDLCKSSLKEGKQKFLSVVSETFMCICCQELVFKPITTKCKHNFCLLCLKRSFKAEVYSCPTCRSELGKDFKMDINTVLSNCLLMLFPGYETGR